MFLLFLMTIYLVYIIFESFSGLARFGGYKSGAISVGVSIQNQILSLNRLIGFLIAPMIGFFVDTGGTSQEIYFIGLIGSVAGGGALLVVFYNWSFLTEKFSNISNSLVINGYNVRSFLIGFQEDKKSVSHKFKIFKWNYFLAQTFTTGLAMPSVFLLNIIAINTPEYSSTLLQMTTVISGIGNLVLNFYTIPLVSVEESDRKSTSVEDSHRSIFLGKMCGMLILSPLLFVSAFYLYM